MSDSTNTKPVKTPSDLRGVEITMLRYGRTMPRESKGPNAPQITSLYAYLEGIKDDEPVRFFTVNRNASTLVDEIRMMRPEDNGLLHFAEVRPGHEVSRNLSQIPFVIDVFNLSEKTLGDDSTLLRFTRHAPAGASPELDAAREAYSAALRAAYSSAEPVLSDDHLEAMTDVLSAIEVAPTEAQAEVEEQAPATVAEAEPEAVEGVAEVTDLKADTAEAQEATAGTEEVATPADETSTATEEATSTEAAADEPSADEVSADEVSVDEPATGEAIVADTAATEVAPTVDEPQADIGITIEMGEPQAADEEKADEPAAATEESTAEADAPAEADQAFGAEEDTPEDYTSAELGLNDEQKASEDLPPEEKIDTERAGSKVEPAAIQPQVRRNRVRRDLMSPEDAAAALDAPPTPAAAQSQDEPAPATDEKADEPAASKAADAAPQDDAAPQQFKRRRRPAPPGPSM